MARFLVDESLPRSVVRALVAAGHDAVDGRDVGLRGRPDAEVASRAHAEQRIIVSEDGADVATGYLERGLPYPEMRPFDKNKDVKALAPDAVASLSA